MERSTNTSVIATVLCTCLGLLVVGVPTQVASQSVKHGVRVSTEALHSRLVVNAKADAQSPYQSGMLAAANTAYFWSANSRKLAQPDAVSYQNSIPLVEDNRVVIVTHLARAAISDSLAKEPALS